MRQAPDANGFFVGDYEGLSALGTTFYPFWSQSDNAGTNVFALPISARVPASYGNGSFTRHLHLAMQAGYRVEVRVDPFLALDVDNPDDLVHPLLAHLLPQWLRTILASRR